VVEAEVVEAEGAIDAVSENANVCVQPASQTIEHRR
jgi:hypothetical protein